MIEVRVFFSRFALYLFMRRSNSVPIFSFILKWNILSMVNTQPRVEDLSLQCMKFMLLSSAWVKKNVRKVIKINCSSPCAYFQLRLCSHVVQITIWLINYISWNIFWHNCCLKLYTSNLVISKKLKNATFVDKSFFTNINYNVFVNWHLWKTF